MQKPEAKRCYLLDTRQKKKPTVVEKAAREAKIGQGLDLPNEMDVELKDHLPSFFVL